MASMHALSMRCMMLLLAAVLGAQALYEDQVGTFDWYKQYVGEVTSADLQQGQDRLYVATQQNLVAALSIADGNVIWRRTFNDADPLGKMLLLDKPQLMVTVSKQGKYVRAWSLADGAFKWEAVLLGPVHANTSFDAAVALLEGGRSQSVLLVSDGRVEVYEASRGDAAWSSNLPEDIAEANNVIFSTGEHVMVASYTPGQAKLSVTEFEAADGARLSDAKIWTSAEPLGSALAASKDHVALLSQHGTSLCTAALSSEGGQLQCVSLGQLDGKLQGAKGISLQATPAGVAVVTAHHGVAVLSHKASRLELLAHIPDATAVSAPVAGADGAEQLGVVRATSSKGLELTVVDAASGATLHTSSPPLMSLPYPSLGAPSAPRRAFLAVTKGRAGGSKPAYAAAVVWSDHALQLVARGAVVWHREEALGGVQRSMFVELPGAAAGAKDIAAEGDGGIFGDRFKRWLRLQVLSVLIQFKMNSPAELLEHRELRQALSDNNKVTRDPNGFRKLILVTTAANKVLALHNGDGRVVWAHQYVEASAEGGTGHTWLLPWRNFHDLTHAPQVAFLSSVSGQLSILNAHSGAEVETRDLPEPVGKVVPVGLPLQDGQADQRVYLLLSPWDSTSDATPKLQLVPDTAAARQLLSAHHNSLFFYLVDEASGAVAGFGLDGEAVADGRHLRAVPAWRLQLPGKVLAVAAKDPTEPIQSLVKVLGDRSLMYKYVNPNILFAATYTPGDPAAAAAGADSDPEEGRVTVHLIDTVTGALLVRQSHLGARGPVHAVLSEHWLVYTLWDAVAIRPQAHVVELYDASPRDLSLEAIIRGRTSNSSSTQAVSSYAPPAINVLAQAWYLQAPVKGLAVTRTGQGITTKQVLMSTITDQVYAMDKRFLDPRRPMRTKPTPQDMEEQLIPYSDTLMFAPNLHVTHARVIAQLRGVDTAPSDLESTCLVFVHGADLFYTRVTPARHFDSLEPDFSYGLLTVGLVALAIGTWVARVYTNKAMLKAKWQ